MESASPTTMENGNNNNRPIYLDVDGTNPDRLWCVLTGTQTGHKILQSDDAGETWQDWTTGTIGERVVSVAHQRGSNGGVYVGTTNAVYFRDATMDDWVLYNQGLPMINVCTFLQVDYCGGHIRAAGTRGVHQAPLFFLSVGGVHGGSNAVEFGQPLRVTVHSRVCLVGGSSKGPPTSGRLKEGRSWTPTAPMPGLTTKKRERSTSDGDRRRGSFRHMDLVRFGGGG